MSGTPSTLRRGTRGLTCTWSLRCGNLSQKVCIIVEHRDGGSAFSEVADEPRQNHWRPLRRWHRRRGASMSVTLLFFARARDLAGVRSADFPIPAAAGAAAGGSAGSSNAGGAATSEGAEKPSCTLAELKAAIVSKYPDLGELLAPSTGDAPSIVVAVNQEFADSDEQRIRAGDEVAVVPPVSGG